jgi:hypothetical protein
MRIGRGVENGSSSTHSQSLLPGHGLTGELSEGEIDRLGLGPDPEAFHDGLYIGILDLDVGANPTHTRSIHINV